MSESRDALGKFLREQRLMAQLSLRDMARLSRVSNAYLSQVERGFHAPSLRVLRALADALNMPVEDLLHLRAGSAGSVEEGASMSSSTTDVEAAIKRDPRLAEQHKQALLAVYRSYLQPERS